MTTATFAPIDFQSIASYKEWRTQWKQQYNQLSADIRSARQAVREAQRAHSLAMLTSADNEQRVAIRKARSVLWNVIYDIEAKQSTARAALELRQQSKIKAAQLYILEHRVETTSEV